ncbi:PREDICTED: protein WFDC11 [Condylura cristata]|uniref:protein WFDC11 n=1 Tax=Condylura cristata TaxID=143302 RepID=UPI0003346142|nr:PREDICTED: protein WFDC11 [Condylura cristata]
MKFWTSVLMASFCVTLLSVMGGLKENYADIEMIIEECRGEANVQQCAKRCSKTFKCADVNHTCCWTHCGNICLGSE